MDDRPLSRLEFLNKGHKRLILSIAIAASFGQYSLAEEKRVTFTSGAIRAPELIKTLAEQTGERLLASGDVSSDVLVVSVNDVPLKELLERIAWATNAEWKQQDSGLVLLRSPAKKDAEAKAEQAHASRLFGNHQAKLKEKVAASGAFGQAEAEALLKAVQAMPRPSATSAPPWSIFQKAPPGRAIDRLLLLIKPEELAALPFTRATVYSTHPNSMQKALPPAANEVLRQLSEEHRLWMTLSESVLANNLEAKIYYGLMHETLRDRTPGKINLVLARKDAGALQARLLVFCAKGDYIFGSPPVELPEHVGAKTPTDKLEDDPEIDLSSISLSFLEDRKKNDQMYLPKGEWTALFRNAENRDPLGILVTDALFGLAKLQSLNIVACPEDHFLHVLASYAADGKLRLSEVLQAVSDDGTEVVKDGGWFGLRPITPGMARRLRLSRSLLAGAVDRVYRQGHLTLTEALPLIQAQHQPAFRTLAPVVDSFVHGYQQHVTPELHSWLKFYAALEPEKRAAISEGNLPQFSEIQRTLLHDALLQPAYGHVQWQDGNGLQVRVSEASEWLGAGSGLRLTVTHTLEQAVRGFNPGGSATRVQSVMHYGSMQVLKEKLPPEHAGLAASFSPPLLRPATLESISFSAYFHPLVSTTQFLQWPTEDRRSEPVAYEKLPEDLRRAIELEIKKARENPGGGGQGGQ